jgi:hypothetical protein
MLFKNFYNNHDQLRLNEGNFISSDFLGLFDSDAKFRLKELTIDKLFEGLDIEKSQELHNIIKSNIPSTASVMGLSDASKNSAFDLVKTQVSYIDSKIINVEKELKAGFDLVLSATQTSYKDRAKKISEITNPSGISSVIPKIDEAVKNFMKSTTIDFKSESLKQSFISLYKLDISNIISQTLTSLEQSASTVGLKGLYTIIDGIDLQEIEDTTAQINPKILISSQLDLIELIKSNDIYDRLGSFYEMVMNMFPYGQQLTTKFGKDYSSINLTSGIVGPDAIMAMKQFIPSIDSSIFEPMSELLNEVSSILVKRVFVQSPDEDLKYIFTPSLQVMYMCMISLVSLKLIDLNLQVKSLVIKTEEQIKKDAEKKVYDEKVQRVKNLLDVTNKLESMNFLKKGGLVYKVGSTKMSSEVIKLINNYFVILKFLPPYKFNDTNYDATTAEGVTKFQEAYGLKFVDGKIGNETKGEMKEVANGYKIKYNIQNVESGVMGSYGL